MTILKNQQKYLKCLTNERKRKQIGKVEAGKKRVSIHLRVQKSWVEVCFTANSRQHVSPGICCRRLDKKLGDCCHQPARSPFTAQIACAAVDGRW